MPVDQSHCSDKISEWYQLQIARRVTAEGA